MNLKFKCPICDGISFEVSDGNYEIYNGMMVICDNCEGLFVISISELSDDTVMLDNCEED